MTLPGTFQPLDIFDPSSYPSRRNEDWKYSDLTRVLRAAPERARAGSYFSASHHRRKAPEGFVELNGGYGHLEDAWNAVRDKLYIRHYGFGSDVIAGNQEYDGVRVEAGKSLTVVEDFSGEGSYAAHTVLRMRLDEGAKLTHVVILDEPEDAVSIRRSTVETAPGSVFKQYVFSTGAKFQRFETHVSHAGHGAVVEMHGAYLLKDKRHFDLTTRVTHADIDGETSQLIKGLVKDQATSVFQGRILVERGADGTDARMRHQALILNDGAHVRAKPELEIYADDVQCAHGNTIGALDEEALFFCQSRGMSEEVARALLTHAFVLPVADLIEDDGLRDKVMAFLTNASEQFHAV